VKTAKLRVIYTKK